MQKRFFIDLTTAFALILCLLTTAFSQKSPDAERISAPASSGLAAIEVPDLSEVEKDVRDHITAFQNELKTRLNVPDPPPRALAESYGTLGQIYHAYSFLSAADQSYSNAAKLDPEDFRWSYLRAKLFEDRGSFGDAAAFYQKSISQKPDYTPAFINLGNAYLQLNSLTAAKEAFESALKINSEDPAALFGLGQVFYAQKDFETAIGLFEKVIAKVPGANRVHYSLALAYRDLKNTEKANFHLEKQGTVGIRPADPIFDALDDLKKGVRLRLLRGKMALEAGRVAEAEEELRKALAAEPENVSALVNYGFTLAQLNRLPEAAVYLERAVDLDPRNTNALYNLAVVFSVRKKHFLALENLKKLLAVDPNDINARFLLAKELRDADLLIESQNEFLKVYNANPDNEAVLLEAVKLLVKKGDGAIAKSLLEKANSKFPDRKTTASAFAYFLAAAPQRELRDGAKSLNIARALYENDKTTATARVLALALSETGNCSEAVKLINEELKTLKNAGDARATDIFQVSFKNLENKTDCRPE